MAGLKEKIRQKKFRSLDGKIAALCCRQTRLYWWAYKVWWKLHGKDVYDAI